MKFGIFGGSFDPVHIGHIQLALACRDQVPLDTVCFIPAAQQPLKQEGPYASDDDRLAMLELAIGGIQQMVISRIEIERSGVSYTIDTLRTIAQTQPQDELFLLLGSDALADFPSWRQIKKIIQMATPIIVIRSGGAEIDWNVLADWMPKQRIVQLRQLSIHMPPVDVSSTEIRRRISLGQSINGLVPPAVAEYITQHGLYSDRIHRE